MTDPVTGIEPIRYITPMEHIYSVVNGAYGWFIFYETKERRGVYPPYNCPELMHLYPSKNDAETALSQYARVMRWRRWKPVPIRPDDTDPVCDYLHCAHGMGQAGAGRCPDKRADWRRKDCPAFVTEAELEKEMRGE